MEVEEAEAEVVAAEGVAALTINVMKLSDRGGHTGGGGTSYVRGPWNGITLGGGGG